MIKGNLKSKREKGLLLINRCMKKKIIKRAATKKRQPKENQKEKPKDLVMQMIKVKKKKKIKAFSFSATDQQ